MKPATRHANLALFTFAAVPTLFALAVLFAPAMQGVVLSFERGGPSLGNYALVLRDRFFWRALAGNLIVPAGSLVVEFRKSYYSRWPVISSCRVVT
jgi:ABC-type sugar transport system permease subunit